MTNLLTGLVLGSALTWILMRLRAARRRVKSQVIDALCLVDGSTARSNNGPGPSTPKPDITPKPQKRRDD